nr:retrovirus-related Pol polyprotein [Tanacetum cinerariifolium]
MIGWTEARAPSFPLQKKVGFRGSLISTPPVLVRSGPWSYVSGLPAYLLFEIDQPAGLVWLFFSIEKELGGAGYRVLARLDHRRYSRLVVMGLKLLSPSYPLDFWLGKGRPLSPEAHGRLVRLLRAKLKPRELVLPPDELCETEESKDFLEYSLLYGWMDAPRSGCLALLEDGRGGRRPRSLLSGTDTLRSYIYLWTVHLIKQSLSTCLLVRGYASLLIRGLPPIVFLERVFSKLFDQDFSEAVSFLLSGSEFDVPWSDDHGLYCQISEWVPVGLSWRMASFRVVPPPNYLVVCRTCVPVFTNYAVLGDDVTTRKQEKDSDRFGSVTGEEDRKVTYETGEFRGASLHESILSPQARMKLGGAGYRVLARLDHRRYSRLVVMGLKLLFPSYPLDFWLGKGRPLSPEAHRRLMWKFDSHSWSHLRSEALVNWGTIEPMQWQDPRCQFLKTSLNLILTPTRAIRKSSKKGKGSQPREGERGKDHKAKIESQGQRSLLCFISTFNYDSMRLPTEKSSKKGKGSQPREGGRGKDHKAKIESQDFSVFRNSFGTCLSHLDKMLKQCEDTNLSLNLEKSHFMVKEGFVLGLKISKNGIEVDKAKVDVIAKLAHPTTGKECIEAFQTLKNKLTEAPILVALD